MNTQIRKAILSDLSDIQKVIENSYLPFLDLIPPDSKIIIAEETLRELITNDNKDIWVAIFENNIVGVSAGIITDKSIYHLKLLFVNNKFQNQGIASSLLKVFEEKGMDNGSSLLTTNYQKWASWSLSFYLKYGYKEFEDKDELLNEILKENVKNRREIGIFNTRHKRFLWKNIKKMVPNRSLKTDLAAPCS